MDKDRLYNTFLKIQVRVLNVIVANSFEILEVARIFIDQIMQVK